MTYTDVLLRLVTALVLGGLVGYERQARSKAAGLRTHILVSMGACLCMMVSLSLPVILQREAGVFSDGGRIAAQVVSGVGFLGAGTILAAQGTRHITGLTTAASIWAVAAVGLAAGAGLFFMAAVTAGFILVTLTVLRIIDLRLSAKRRARCYELRLTVDAARFSPDALRAFLADRAVHIRAFDARHLSGGRDALRLLVEEEDGSDPLTLDMLLLTGVEQASIEPASR